MKFFKDYSESEQYALKNEICDKCNENQINYYLRVCESKNVDPFSGLLYIAIRGGKAKVSYTIDAKRMAAAKSGFYAGSDVPEFDSEEAKTPIWCKVTVYRMVNGARCAFTAKTRYEEMKNPNWGPRPYHMHAIATEAQALRKAFPDFVADDGEEYEPETNTATVSKEDESLRERIMKYQLALQALEKIGFTEEQVLKELGIASKMEITDEHLAALRKLHQENKK